MGDRKFTLLELHFDDGFQIGPRSLGGDEEADAERSGRDADVGDDETTSKSRPMLATAVKALAVLGILAVGAKAAIRVAGPDDVPPIELDEAAEEVESPAD